MPLTEPPPPPHHTTHPRPSSAVVMRDGSIQFFFVQLEFSVGHHSYLAGIRFQRGVPHFGTGLDHIDCDVRVVTTLHIPSYENMACVSPSSDITWHSL